VVGQGAQRQWADPRRGDVVGDVAAVLDAGGLVDAGQVVDVVAAPAGDGVAVVGGLPGAPDLQGRWKSTASRWSLKDELVCLPLSE
jgi:hypothetical protein